MIMQRSGTVVKTRFGPEHFHALCPAGHGTAMAKYDCSG
jgi:hypothetical protein